MFDILWLITIFEEFLFQYNCSLTSQYSYRLLEQEWHQLSMWQHIVFPYGDCIDNFSSFAIWWNDRFSKSNFVATKHICDENICQLSDV